MRYFKGSKIEVLNYVLDPPSISWRPMEIISGNGRSYHVRNLHDPAAVEKVPRKLIRPCPPLVEGPRRRSWVSGDIVEVFEGNSWKPALVTRVLTLAGGVDDLFFVKLVGFSKEFGVHASSIRVRQTWQEDKWVVMGNVVDHGVIDSRPKFGNCNLQMPTQSCQQAKKKRTGGDHQFPNAIDDSFQEHYQASSPPRSMNKRPRLTSPLVETCDQTDKPVDALGKEEKWKRLVTRYPYLLEKVDHPVAPPCLKLGFKHMFGPLCHRPTITSKLDMDRMKPNARLNDAQSIRSSVGSCDGRSSVGSCSGNNDHEVQSSYDPGREEQSLPRIASPLLPRLQSPDKEVHQLELSAYRSTMVAFHAAGPLTWGKETLLTNLRHMLHISGDEHLLELRRLVSANTYVHHSREEAIPISL